MSIASTYAEIRTAFREWLDAAPPGARKVAYRGDLDADRTDTGKAVRAALKAIAEGGEAKVLREPDNPARKLPERVVIVKGATND